MTNIAYGTCGTHHARVQWKADYHEVMRTGVDPLRMFEGGRFQTSNGAIVGTFRAAVCLRKCLKGGGGTRYLKEGKLEGK